MWIKNSNWEILTKNLVLEFTFKRCDGVKYGKFQYYEEFNEKSAFYGGQKNREELPKKGGLGQFPYLKLGLAKNKGGVDTLMHTYVIWMYWVGPRLT